MVSKGLKSGREELEIGERIETIQTTALLRVTRILRRVLKISEKPLANSSVKNSQGV